MQRTTVLMLVHESDERETVDTSADVVEETIRHIPIRKRPTVHKPLPEAFVKLAKWAAQ